jgi:hypothetical protein
MSPFDELWLYSFGYQTELANLDKTESLIQNEVEIS